MQTIVQVMCTGAKSMRLDIVNDSRLKKHEFEIIQEKKLGRSPGWLKVSSYADGRRGSLNIQWHPATKILTCRIINRGSGRPNLVLGDFVDYLLERHRKRIKLITVVPGN